MLVRPVAMTSSTQSGSTSTASVVLTNRTKPAMSQTVRSIYQRSVGTM
jgi:hypothetical protein